MLPDKKGWVDLAAILRVGNAILLAEIEVIDFCARFVESNLVTCSCDVH
jgi:hypothetical protein